FYTEDVPTYPFDLKKAEALLEAAGLKRNAQGIRLTFTNDPNDSAGLLFRTAQVLRSNLARIGVRMEIRTQDFGEFVNRVYTRRDFDTILYTANAGPDPAIGTQRFYWSKNIQPGVAFSNGAAYNNPEVDRLLEAAQVEIDPVKRRALYVRFQQVVQTDLPKIPLISSESVLVAHRNLRDFLTSGDGGYGNFADAYLARGGAL
ncbi:MAG: ABC transporter substrate-binding protein, partial [Rhizobacter sp.]